MQPWCKTWVPNGSRRIRAKQKLLRQLKRACTSSLSRIGSLKSFTLTVPRNLARLLKIFPAIIVRQHHTDQKQTWLLREQCAEWKSGLDEKWWADSMECSTYLRNIQDLLSVGKTPCERRFAQPFRGPIIPFGSLVEYYPISAKDQSRIHQFGKKVLPGIFLAYALYAGNFGRVTQWLQTSRSWKGWTHQKSTLKDSMQRKSYFPNKMENPYSQSQMDEKIRWRRCQGDGVSKTGLQQAAADSQGSRTCVSASTLWTSGRHTQGEKCRGTLQSPWQYLQWVTKEGEPGCPKRVSGRHVVRGRQASRVSVAVRCAPG